MQSIICSRLRLHDARFSSSSGALPLFTLTVRPKGGLRLLHTKAGLAAGRRWRIAKVAAGGGASRTKFFPRCQWDDVSHVPLDGGGGGGRAYTRVVRSMLPPLTWWRAPARCQLRLAKLPASPTFPCLCIVFPASSFARIATLHYSQTMAATEKYVEKIRTYVRRTYVHVHAVYESMHDFQRFRQTVLY